MNKLLTAITSFLILAASCSPDPKTQHTSANKESKLTKLEAPLNNTIVKKGEAIEVNLVIKGNATHKIDSIGIYVDDRYQRSLDLANSKIELNTDKLKLGRNNLLVKVFKKDGKQENKFAQLKVIGSKVPKQYGFEVVNTYPHNKNSYTQGLLFHKGYLYESTGQRGKSKLLKVDIETGKPIQEYEIPENYFGEGLALLNDRLFQLTWTSGQGFIYDLNSLKPIGNFSFTGEGWGICSNGKNLIMSNGTNELLFLNPDNFKVEKKMQVMDNKGQIAKLNELEYIKGEIWANYYEYNKFLIYRINPNTGEVNGVIDLNGILKKDDAHPLIDVLNGIAYDAEKNRIFVTGKNYPKLYEVRVMEK